MATTWTAILTMKHKAAWQRWLLLWLTLLGACASSPQLLAQVAAARGSIVVLSVEGTVEFARAGAAFTALAVNQVLLVGDRIRTGPFSRVALRWTDQSVIRMGPDSEMNIQPPPAGKTQTSFEWRKGLLYFFHRDKPADLQFRTPTATAAIRGTEFNLSFAGGPNDATILTLVDGVMVLSNNVGSIDLHGGEEGTAVPGQPPTKTAKIEINSIIQWCLYYPAVLDVDELGLSAPEEQILSESLAAYRNGDLLAALAKYPAGRVPASAQEAVYFGALLLAVGEVEQAEALFGALPAASAANTLALAQAIRRMIALVKLQPRPPARPAQSATEWMVESYYLQSQSHQPDAILDAVAAARKAVEIAPGFGYGWERVAELEFSRGQIGRALEALDTSLRLAPLNAQALALKGFLLAAQNKISSALVLFDQAIARDPALANAWLGRGLCQIRQNKSEAGRADLLVAASVEPNRALLRSYLGKAYSNAGDSKRALTEIHRAMELDKNDPTAWLYRALLNQQNNRINEAVRDLEHSADLNDNRSLYRSRLALDQDRAVRSANLAGIYRDAGMFDVSVWEASRAVASDYANYSAHLFLANSYDALRDPKQINLRYETAATAEYLLANLLAPVGAGALSQTISQQEYSKLLERDGFGLSSSTEYFSGGDWVQSGAQYGTFGHTSYDVEAFYRSDNGQRPNNDLEQRSFSARFRQQLSPRDTVYLQAIYYQASSGDLLQYYDQASANIGKRVEEKQEPIFVAGYHHEWSPGSHTLFLYSRLNDTLEVSDPAQQTYILEKNVSSVVTTVSPIQLQQAYRGAFDIHSAEAQHLWHTPTHSSVVGAHFQWGDFHTHNIQTEVVRVSNFNFVPVAQDFTTPFERFTCYGYHSREIVPSLRLIGGLSYDWIKFPENFRAAPISDRQASVDQLSPKVGLVWTPGKDTSIRAAYTRSLGGASFDQSFQLEPSQVAGFLQSFRSLVPESLGGSSAGEQFETYGVTLEQKFRSRTYFGLGGELLKSKATRSLGVFDAPYLSDDLMVGQTPERLRYEERTLLATLNQLVGKEWAFGVRYRLSRAEADSDLTDVAAQVFPGLHLVATLHQLSMDSIYSHPSGFFAHAQAVWYHQRNEGDSSSLAGADFWQFNLYAGYRFPNRRAEVTVGLLNVTDQDYQLNPLNLYTDPLRERTFYARLRFNF